MKKPAALLACLATLSAASAAHAIEIDFTSIAGNPNGASSWSTTVDGVTVSVIPGPKGTKLYWDSEDGFGVNGGGVGYEVDEIDGNERLYVTFTDASGKPVEVHIESFGVTDLFNEAKNSGWGNYDEVGYYATQSGSYTMFTAGTVADHSNVNGTGTVAVGADSWLLLLKAPGKTNYGKEDHEFSLGGISFEVASVPELGATGAVAAMFLLGGLGLVATGRRRRVIPTLA